MKKFLLSLLTLLALQAMYLVSPSTAHAEEMSCPPPISVVIDIKAGDSLNKINLSARGLLPVAVLSSGNFAAGQFSPVMAHMNDASMPMGCTGAEAVRWSYEDVNKDGKLDLIFFFRIQDLNLTSSSTSAILMAHGMYGSTEIHIEGIDSVTIKP